MSNIKSFSSKKEVSIFLKEKGIDTSNWSEVKWLKLNKGQSEIHLMDLAEKMYDYYNESIPKTLEKNEFHIPFEEDMNINIIKNLYSKNLSFDEAKINLTDLKIKISVAKCARISYTIFDNDNSNSIENDLKLYDKLLESKHLSPFEHCARVMTDKEYYNFFKGINPNTVDIKNDGFGWCNNYKGWISYRYFLENKNI